MQVDFYRLGTRPLPQVLAAIAGRVLGQGGRLLVVAEPARAAELDTALWSVSAESFLPHGRATPADPGADQPVLIAEAVDGPANGARFVALADGRWRDEALGFDRAFHLFDEDAIGEAREAWRALGGRDGITRNFWSQDEAGRWAKIA